MSVRLNYNATSRVVRVSFLAIMYSACVTVSDKTDVKGRTVTNRSLDRHFRIYANWARTRLDPLCPRSDPNGDTTICPVSLSDGVATAHDAGSINPGTLTNQLLAPSAAYFDQEGWDFRLSAKIGG